MPVNYDRQSAAKITVAARRIAAAILFYEPFYNIEDDAGKNGNNYRRRQ